MTSLVNCVGFAGDIPRIESLSQYQTLPLQLAQQMEQLRIGPDFPHTLAKVHVILHLLNSYNSTLSAEQIKFLIEYLIPLLQDFPSADERREACTFLIERWSSLDGLPKAEGELLKRAWIQKVVGLSKNEWKESCFEAVINYCNGVAYYTPEAQHKALDFLKNFTLLINSQEQIDGSDSRSLLDSPRSSLTLNPSPEALSFLGLYLRLCSSLKHSELPNRLTQQLFADIVQNEDRPLSEAEFEALENLIHSDMLSFQWKVRIVEEVMDAGRLNSETHQKITTLLVVLCETVMRTTKSLADTPRELYMRVLSLIFNVPPEAGQAQFWDSLRPALTYYLDLYKPTKWAGFSEVTQPNPTQDRENWWYIFCDTFHIFDHLSKGGESVENRSLKRKIFHFAADEIFENSAIIPTVHMYSFLAKLNEYYQPGDPQGEDLLHKLLWLGLEKAYEAELGLKSLLKEEKGPEILDLMTAHCLNETRATMYVQRLLILLSNQDCMDLDQLHRLFCCASYILKHDSKTTVSRSEHVAQGSVECILSCLPSFKAAERFVYFVEHVLRLGNDASIAELIILIGRSTHPLNIIFESAAKVFEENLSIELKESLVHHMMTRLEREAGLYSSVLLAKLYSFMHALIPLSKTFLTTHVEQITRILRHPFIIEDIKISFSTRNRSWTASAELYRHYRGVLGAAQDKLLSLMPPLSILPRLQMRNNWKIAFRRILQHMHLPGRKNHEGFVVKVLIFAEFRKDIEKIINHLELPS